MFDRVFQIIGKKSVTPEGVVQYPAQDQLTGEFLPLNMGIEDAGILDPGDFLCCDTVHRNNAAYLPEVLIERAQYLGCKDFTIRFGKILKVFDRKKSDPVRFSLSYRGDSDQLLVVPFQMAHWISEDGAHITTKHPKIVDNRIMVLALSASDITVVLACWPLDEDL
jgi:hypothetical protein